MDWKTSFRFEDDPLDELKKQPIPTVENAYSALVQCIIAGAARCVRWLIGTYPGLANYGTWNVGKGKPLEHVVCNITGALQGPLLPEMILIMLEAGAEHTERFGKGNILELLLRYRGYSEPVHIHTATHHLVDYGAWVCLDCQIVGLRSYWESCYCQRAARVLARKALFHRLRAKGMPRDVAKLVVLSAPLSDALSWKEWEVK